VKKWNQGREVIQRLLDSGELQEIKLDQEHAEKLLRQARAHLSSAVRCQDDDLEGAYTLLYDAARKSLVALLEIQGLRPTTQGGHIVVFEALIAQLQPPMGSVINPFNRMRRMRRVAEYPQRKDQDVTEADVREDLEKAEEIVKLAEKLIGELPPF
jgi:uncharacterized protein (UPF0332 family)